MGAGVVQMCSSKTGVQVYMCTTDVLAYYMGTGVVQGYTCTVVKEYRDT
jgi:hypothetical protein